MSVILRSPDSETIDVMRTREVVGRVPRPCQLCGSADVVAVRTRLVRRGLDRLRPGFNPHEHRYELCRGCGSKNLEVGTTAIC